MNLLLNMLKKLKFFANFKNCFIYKDKIYFLNYIILA